jgi:hypothetical protein
MGKFIEPTIIDNVKVFDSLTDEMRIGLEEDYATVKYMETKQVFDLPREHSVYKIITITAYILEEKTFIISSEDENE